MRSQLREETVTQALQTIERRVNEFGVAEPIVAPTRQQRRPDSRAAPRRDRRRAREGPHSLDRAARAQAGRGWTGTDTRSAARRLRRQRPAEPGSRAGHDERGVVGQAGSTVYYLVRAVAGGHRSRPAQRPPDPRREQPARRRLLAEQRGRAQVRAGDRREHRPALAIILDGRVQSAPTIEGRITDEGRITAARSRSRKRTDLSLMLRSGALPASLTYLEERTVGPSLGADSIRAGIIASLVGLGWSRCSCCSTTGWPASTPSSRWR